VRRLLSSALRSIALLALALTALPTASCCAPPAPPPPPVVVRPLGPGKPHLPAQRWWPDPALADQLLHLAARLRAEAAGLDGGGEGAVGRAALLRDAARALERAHVEGTRAEVYVGELEEHFQGGGR
jgi:hypothetical protein